MWYLIMGCAKSHDGFRVKEIEFNSREAADQAEVRVRDRQGIIWSFVTQK